MVGAVQGKETVLKEIQTAVRHMAVYGIGGILVKALGFFMLPFYTHYLSPGDYGTPSGAGYEGINQQARWSGSARRGAESGCLRQTQRLIR